MQLTISPVLEILKKVDISKIDAVEILGGGIRVPKIQTLLGEIFGQIPVGAHMNGDESMAQGAVFYAANISKSFKVR